MEKIIDKKNWPLLFIGLFFASMIFFQFWQFPFADYPQSDEFYSILKALGLEVYNKTLYVQILSVFALFFKSFESLVKFSFIFSHLFLAAAFFYYHHCKKIHPAVNLFFTGLLVLSPLSLALTRKLHFWAAALFFLGLGMVHDKPRDQKEKSLALVFVVLTFLRYEFFFPAVIFLWRGFFYRKLSQARWVFPLLVLVPVVLIYFLGPGMRELFTRSWQEGFIGVGKNILYMGYNSLHSIDIVFTSFFPTVALSLVLLLAFADWKDNLQVFKKIALEEYLFTFLPVLTVLILIHYNDHYALMGFLFILSGFCFLLNVKQKSWLTPLLFLLMTSAFFVRLPDYNDPSRFFYHIRRHGPVQKEALTSLEARLRQLSASRPLRLLTDRPVVLHALFPALDLSAVSDISLESFCRQPQRASEADVLLWMKPQPASLFCFQTSEFEVLSLLPNYFFLVRKN